MGGECSWNLTNVDFFHITKISYFPFSVCVYLSEVAPYLRGGGQGQQVMLEGNRLVLTCLAGGSWPLQYRWTLNSSNITDWTPQYRSDWLVMCLIFLCPGSLSFLYVCLSVYLTSFSLRLVLCVESWKNSCRIRAWAISDGMCLEKVRTFRQHNQSEINNYICTINMYMVWGKTRRTNQYVWASSSASLSMYLSAASLPQPLSVCPCVC